MLEARFVKRGLWHNVEKGPTLGWTYTTDTQTGTMLVVLLAILTSLALANLWHLIAFGFHQFRADGKPADGLFRQQQALLRTLPMPGSMLSDSLKLWWIWRKKTDRVLCRSLIPLALAIVFSASTIAAGIFASFIVDTTNLQVLVDSPLCGPIKYNVTTKGYNKNYKKAVYNKRYQIIVSDLGRSLAEECYGANATTSERCRTFIRPNITFEQQRVECPFDPSICVDIPNPGIRFDSGLLDLNDDFGLNLADRDRVKYRKRTTCAVVKTQDRSSIINASAYPPLDPLRPAMPGEELLLLHYGNATDAGGWKNTTWVQSLLSANMSTTFGNIVSMYALASPTWKAFSSLQPVEELQLDDADLHLVMIPKNRQTFFEQNDDPLFAAHQPMLLDVNAPANPEATNTTIYLSDFPVSVVGCALQYQFCLSRPQGPDLCTRLAGITDYMNEETYPEASEIQLAAVNVLLKLSATFDVRQASTDGLPISAWTLQPGGPIMELASDRWTEELAAWESRIWASLQIAVTDYAIGPRVREPLVTLGTLRYETGDLDAGERQLCQVQRMNITGGFVNINVFGLYLVAGIALALYLLDLVLLKFLIFLSRFRRALAPRIDRWIQDGVFQLQRRAFEAREEGDWQRKDQEIPITSAKKLLSDLASNDCAWCLEQGRTTEYECDLSREGCMDDEIARKDEVGVMKVAGRVVWCDARGDHLIDKKHVPFHSLRRYDSGTWTEIQPSD